MLQADSCALLVIAHPDDEVMFFAPCLLRLKSTFAGDNIHVLSISSGNDMGLGKTRQVELQKSCQTFGISPSNITVVEHPLLQDGMANEWPHEIVAAAVLERIRTTQCDLILTFDDYGVSGHPNHIATYHGVRLALAQACKSSSQRLRGWKLDSRSLLRKFSGPLDIIYSYFADDHIFINFDPCFVLKGLAIHVSQNALYRQLFVLFSSFTYVNSFSEIKS